MSLVTRTPLALETGHRDLPNRVGRGHVYTPVPGELAGDAVADIGGRVAQLAISRLPR
jgi:hypothetical protein